MGARCGTLLPEGYYQPITLASWRATCYTDEEARANAPLALCLHLGPLLPTSGGGPFS